VIVKMKKVFLVARAAGREEFLEALRDLGVVHLEPVDPSASAPEELLARLERIDRALQLIASVEPVGEAPELDGRAAAEEILQIARRAEDNRNRLNSLAREAERLAIWGDLRREQLDALEDAGVPVRFYSVDREAAGQIVAECVSVVAELPGKRVLAAVVQRAGAPSLPDDARPVEPPARDLPAVRAEAGEVDAALAADADRLARLAGLGERIRRERRLVAAQAQLAAAVSGAVCEENLFAVQGWVPRESAETLADELAGRGIDAAVQTRDPDPEEDPPTLVRYPRWSGPIKGLFDILGTSPGYREFDVSGFFMIALPIFAAMLIGDAGYGLLFVLLPLVFYRKIVAKAGKVKTHLILVVGAVTVAWGVLSANYFGVTPATMARAGGYVTPGGGVDVEAMAAGAGGWAAVGRVMMAAGPLWDVDRQASQALLIKISFILGMLHLVTARLRAALALAPDLKALAQVGWAVVLVGMLGVVWMLFFGAESLPVQTTVVYALLGAGASLAVLFSYPSKNPLKMLGMGIACSLLPALGTFSDTMSYIRLMAVGLASYYIAFAFNSLGYELAQAATWLAAAPVLVFGHALNIGLAMIAIFAHGVRLNMLEFSNNAGVQWAGYPYNPFAKAQLQES